LRHEQAHQEYIAAIAMMRAGSKKHIASQDFCRI
jgi:hypothetical protein